MSYLKSASGSQMTIVIRQSNFSPAPGQEKYKKEFALCKWKVDIYEERKITAIYVQTMYVSVGWWKKKKPDKVCLKLYNKDIRHYYSSCVFLDCYVKI